MEKQKLSLTSVKIPTNLWDKFKIACIRYKFSFTKLALNSIDLYLTDEEFRRKVTNHKPTK